MAEILQVAEGDALFQMLSQKVATEAVKSCVCGKMVSVAEFGKRWHSGIVNYSEVMCGDCRREIKTHARIVCLSCRTLQGFIPPQRHPSGFRFKADTHYHVDGCTRCKPGTFATPVLEVIAWCQDQRIPIVRDEDIVKEAEQKTSTGQAESARVMESITPLTNETAHP